MRFSCTSLMISVVVEVHFEEVRLLSQFARDVYGRE